MDKGWQSGCAPLCASTAWVKTMFTSYVPAQADHAGMVEQLGAAGIELLYLEGYGPEAGRIIKAVHRRNSWLRLVGGDGLGMEEFWTVAAPAGEGTVFTTRRDPTPSVPIQNFVGHLVRVRRGDRSAQCWSGCRRRT